MVDQSLVQSGFDTELLLGPRYLKYLLLSSVETGSLALQIPINDPGLDLRIRPPEEYTTFRSATAASRFRSSSSTSS